MAIAAATRLLGQILVADGVTTPDLIALALSRSQTTGERIGEALVALGAVAKEDVLRALARQQNVGYLGRDELPRRSRWSRTSRRSICASTSCARSASTVASSPWRRPSP